MPRMPREEGTVASGVSRSALGERRPLPAGGRRDPSAAFAELTDDMERRYRPGTSWWAAADPAEAAGG